MYRAINENWFEEALKDTKKWYQGLQDNQKREYVQTAKKLFILMHPHLKNKPEINVKQEIVKYQKSKGLSPDAIIGPNTAKVIHLDYVKYAGVNKYKTMYSAQALPNWNQMHGIIDKAQKSASQVFGNISKSVKGLLPQDNNSKEAKAKAEKIFKQKLYPGNRDTRYPSLLKGYQKARGIPQSGVYDEDTVESILNDYEKISKNYKKSKEKSKKATDQIMLQIKQCKKQCKNAPADKPYTVLDDINNVFAVVGPNHSVKYVCKAITGKDGGDKADAITFIDWIKKEGLTKTLGTVFSGINIMDNTKKVVSQYFNDPQWNKRITPKGVFVMSQGILGSLVAWFDRKDYGDYFISMQTTSGDTIPFGIHGTGNPDRIRKLKNKKGLNASYGCINLSEEDLTNVLELTEDGSFSFWLPEKSSKYFILSEKQLDQFVHGSGVLGWLDKKVDEYI